MTRACITTDRPWAEWWMERCKQQPYTHYPMAVQESFHPQSKLVPIYRPQKDGRLGEAWYVGHYWVSNPIPPDRKSGAPTITQSTIVHYTIVPYNVGESYFSTEWLLVQRWLVRGLLHTDDSCIPLSCDFIPCCWWLRCRRQQKLRWAVRPLF